MKCVSPPAVYGSRLSCGAQSSAHRLLHERADPCLCGGSQLLQREGDGPHGPFVEVRLVAEAERRVPGVELLRALEEADDLAVLGIRGHSVPESRREGWGAGFDDSMEPLPHGAFRFRHLADLRVDDVFPVCFVRARAAARRRLEFLDALLHRDSFLVRESLELPADRGGALGGLLRFLLWAHRNILILIWVDPRRGSHADPRYHRRPLNSSDESSLIVKIGRASCRETERV